MNTEQVIIKMQSILDKFNDQSTNVDLAFSLLKDAMQKLENLRVHLDGGSDVIERSELSQKVNEIEEFLNLANSKFQINRVESGQRIVSRHLRLVDELKKCL